ncbi:unnamed protein product [Chrysoparadoxa australica]
MGSGASLSLTQANDAAAQIAHLEAEAILRGEGVPECGDGDTTDRVRADKSLLTLLRCPIPRDMFREWLSEQLGEGFLQFWVDCEELKQLPSADVRRIASRAGFLYRTYIAESACKFAGVDKETREDIAKSLCLNERGVVKQKHPDKVRKAFDTAQEKTFQTLRLDFMPLFLTSQTVATLQGRLRNAVLDECEAQRTSRLDGSAGFLESPLVLYHLKKYLSGLACTGPIPPDVYLECLQEIRHCQRNQHTDNRAQRTELIAQRYPNVCEAMETVGSTAEACAESGKTIDSDVFEDMTKECLRLLAPHLESFKRSVEYQGLLDEWGNLEKVANNSRAPNSPVFVMKELSKVDCINSEAEVGRSHSLSPKMRSSSAKSRPSLGGGSDNASDAVVAAAVAAIALEEQVSIDEMLNNPLGLALFKKYNYEHFQEENVNFWVAVNQYRGGEFAALLPLEEEEDGSLHLLRKRRADVIWERYIEEGSIEQVNISTSMRLRVKQGLEAEEEISPGVFDEAQREVLKLMKHNLWHTFRLTDSYLFFVEKYVKGKRRVSQDVQKERLAQPDPTALMPSIPLMNPPHNY